MSDNNDTNISCKNYSPTGVSYSPIEIQKNNIYNPIINSINLLSINKK